MNYIGIAALTIIAIIILHMAYRVCVKYKLVSNIYIIKKEYIHNCFWFVVYKGDRYIYLSSTLEGAKEIIEREKSCPKGGGAEVYSETTNK